jgi:hypothetical protein
MGTIEFIKSMQTLEIKENDILVVKVDTFLSAEKGKDLEWIINKKLPANLRDKVSIFIIYPGMDMGIMRKEEK